MIDSTFFGLVETQLEELKTAEPGRQNQILLQMSKLIIANVDATAEVMGSYDKHDTRLLFSAFADIGMDVKNFFDGSRGYLDPTALSGKIGNKLTLTTEEIAKVSGDIKLVKESEETLLIKELELTELKREFDQLTAKIDELKSIQVTVSPELLAQLRSDIERLSPEIEKLKAEKTELQRISDELNESLQNATDEKGIVASSIVDVIQSHISTLEIILADRGENASEIMRRIEELQRQYAAIDEEVKSTADQLAFWEGHLGENSTIVESMKRYGTKSVADLLDDIERIKGTIADDLKAYDLLLKQIVEHEEGIRDAVAKRQNKR